MATFKTEAELAAMVIAYLENLKWEVFQEVLSPYGIVDIVARQGQILWAVECKLSMSMSLLGQASLRRPYFNYVSIAVPLTKYRDSPTRHFIYEYLQWKGLGLFEVRKRDYDYVDMPYSFRPSLNRKLKSKIKLFEEQKHLAAAGTNNGGYSTPFKRTSRRIVSLVEKCPGIELKELIDKSDHHYAHAQSARQSISNYIRTGVIEGVELRREGRKIKAYPKQKGENIDLNE